MISAAPRAGTLGCRQTQTLWPDSRAHAHVKLYSRPVKKVFLMANAFDSHNLISIKTRRKEHLLFHSSGFML
jgi:hypothetical protein